MVFATPGGSDSRDRFRVEISGRVTCAALIKLAANKTMPHTGEMSALGLGCVKTPWWKHRRLAISAKGPCLIILPCLALLVTDKAGRVFSI